MHVAPLYDLNPSLILSPRSFALDLTTLNIQSPTNQQSVNDTEAALKAMKKELGRRGKGSAEKRKVRID